MKDSVLGVIISHGEYKEYMKLKNKNTPMKKIHDLYNYHCPVCNYVVDDGIPPQRFCDNCGQRLK